MVVTVPINRLLIVQIIIKTLRAYSINLIGCQTLNLPNSSEIHLKIFKLGLRTEKISVSLFYFMVFFNHVSSRIKQTRFR